MSKEAENLMPAMKELHTLRAQVAELEAKVSDWNREANQASAMCEALKLRAESEAANVRRYAEYFPRPVHPEFARGMRMAVEIALEVTRRFGRNDIGRALKEAVEKELADFNDHVAPSNKPR